MNFRTPPLTRTRGWLAVGVAVIADGLQLPLQLVPVAPEVIDVVAAIVTTSLLGFHWLLLPTFLVELIPGIDMMPTWTGCVLAVIALRRKTPEPPASPEIPPVNPPHGNH